MTMSDNKPMRNALKRAMDSQPVPAHLEGKIRATIRSGEDDRRSRFSWNWMFAGFGTAGLAAVALFTFFSLNRHYVQRTDEYVAKLRLQVSKVMGVGLGDHVHCAYFRKYPEPPPPVEKMQRELGPEYAALLDAVKANVPEEFRVRLAHRCSYQGRQFVHLVLKDGERLMSVVVAAKKDGEALSAERLVPALMSSGVPLYQQRAESFQIAAFENSRHLVYLISDLPGEKNVQMLQAMAGGLNDALPKL
jgi:hypothetical protein